MRHIGRDLTYALRVTRFLVGHRVFDRLAVNKAEAPRTRAHRLDRRFALVRGNTAQQRGSGDGAVQQSARQLGLRHLLLSGCEPDSDCHIGDDDRRRGDNDKLRTKRARPKETRLERHPTSGSTANM